VREISQSSILDEIFSFFFSLCTNIFSSKDRRKKKKKNININGIKAADKLKKIVAMFHSYSK
jgi:hypothetical protein